MTGNTKRTTIYFDSEIHKILKLKALEVSKSVSKLVNEIVRNELLEDKSDLEAFDERVSEPTISYEAMLKKLGIPSEAKEFVGSLSEY